MGGCAECQAGAPGSLRAPPCVSPDPGLGTELAGIDDVPAGKGLWQVTLRLLNAERAQWQHICGGSLSHPQWVLTAARWAAP